MADTIDSTGGLGRITRIAPVSKLRLAAFVAFLVAGVALLAWIDSDTWRQVGRLEQEFATIKAESYYVGVHLRTKLRQLNDAQLAYLLHANTAERDRFRREAGELQGWFASREARFSTLKEGEFFNAAKRAFERYRADSLKLLEENRPDGRAEEFGISYERVHGSSQQVLAQCDRLIEVQRQAFDSFLIASQETLVSLERLLKLSFGILVALVVALAALVYRWLVAPLRTQLSESHAEIQRQEKLASLGVLAAGVAHEIRNPLTAIKFRLFSLKKSLPREFAEQEDAAVIGNELNRLERIVKDFLQFARPSEPVLAGVPADRLLQEVCDLLKSEFEKAAIQLRVEPGEPVWVQADSQQIKQVLINLVQNAADSIGRQGVITLRARRDIAALNGRPAPVGVLEVQDTGKGIPPDVRERLFDPFFTTKEGGSGLGLPIAARIVEKHDGDLRYQTHPGRGTTFSIVLPAAQGSEPDPMTE